MIALALFALGVLVGMVLLAALLVWDHRASARLDALVVDAIGPAGRHIEGGAS